MKNNERLKAFREALLSSVKVMAKIEADFDEESIRCLSCGRVMYAGRCCKNPKFKDTNKV